MHVQQQVDTTSLELTKIHDMKEQVDRIQTNIDRLNQELEYN